MSKAEYASGGHINPARNDDLIPIVLSGCYYPSKDAEKLRKKELLDQLNAHHNKQLPVIPD